MNFERIATPNMYGETASNGARSVEVARGDTGTWHVFCYWQGRHISTGSAENYIYKVAKSHARRFLNTGILPTWVVFDPLYWDYNPHGVYVKR